MPKLGSRRLPRLAGAATSGLLVTLVAASGCNDEVGGDGFVPDRPSAGKGGLTASAGAPGGGAPDEGGMGGEPIVSGGKAGSTSHAGSAGKGGHAGTSTMTEGGMGGETAGTAVCGNHVVEPPEQCDDGNTESGDGCTADCKADCEVCEKTYCKAVRSLNAGEHNWFNEEILVSPADLATTCYEMPGLAEGGPAQGVARADLCRDMVDCIRKEKCSQIVADDFGGEGNIYPKGREYAFMRCFCDLEVTDPAYIAKCTNPANFIADDDPSTPDYSGKCKRQIQEASERDDLAIFGGLYTGGRPFGVANSLLQSCDKKLCTEECLPEDTVGVVAQITADILSAESDAGESPLGDLIADAQRSALATDFAFVNRTSYESDLGARGLLFSASPGRPADADGRVLESEIRHVLFGMEPRANYLNQEGGSKLVTLHLTGQQVRDFLESRILFEEGRVHPTVQVSGLAYTWEAATKHVASVVVGTTPLDLAVIYSVTVNDNLAQSISGAADLVVTDKNPEQELVKYLKAQPQPIAPPTSNRVIRTN